MKVQAVVLQTDLLATKTNMGFEWKPNSKGFKNLSVEHACMGHVSSDTPGLRESCTMVGYLSPSSPDTRLEGICPAVLE